MKLGRFKAGNDTHLCKIDGNSVVDLTEAGYGTSMRVLLERLEETRAAIEALNATQIPLSSVELAAPIDDHKNFLRLE